MSSDAMPLLTGPFHTVGNQVEAAEGSRPHEERQHRAREREHEQEADASSGASAAAVENQTQHSTQREHHTEEPGAGSAAGEAAAPADPERSDEGSGDGEASCEVLREGDRVDEREETEGEDADVEHQAENGARHGGVLVRAGEGEGEHHECADDDIVDDSREAAVDHEQCDGELHVRCDRGAGDAWKPVAAEVDDRQQVRGRDDADRSDDDTT